MVLIDTNVMMAASAVRELSNVATRAMPREVELRELVFEWLAAFDLSDTRMVLGLGLSAALNAEIPDTKFGVFRM